MGTDELENRIKQRKEELISDWEFWRVVGCLAMNSLTKAHENEIKEL